MKLFKTYKAPIIFGIIFIIALALAFFGGRNIPNNNRSHLDEARNQGEFVETERISDKNIFDKDAMAQLDESPDDEKSRIETPQKTDNKDNEIELKDAYIPEPIEPENVTISNNELTCTLTIRCDTILNNIRLLDTNKSSLVPENGIIFEEKTVTFYEGESVFNLLLRETKKNKIHMEFVNTPVYDSAYIEGIANIYEFDCGPLSGWMYKVNGWCPNYGCSRYQIKSGDRIEVLYTCDLGKDIGCENSLRGGNNYERK